MSIWQAILTLFRRPPAPVPPAPLPPVPGPPPVASVAQALLAAHNAARAAHNLTPLRLDARLCAAAQGHAEVMVRLGILAHQGLGDGTPWQRIEEQGYRYAAMAENVAEGQPDAVAVVAAWMDDPSHRANVLGYEDFGGGMARSGDVPFWVADYGREAR